MVARAEFEGALRYDEQLLPATAVAIASGKESVVVAIPGTPKVPDADPDREVIWTVDGSTVRFDLSALRAKPTVTVTTTTVLDSTNSVVFSVGSTLCMLARTAASETAASQFLFSADRADTYSVELAVSSIDLEPWARRSNATAKVAAAKLPPPGLTQAQVDARIAALDHPVDAVASKPLTLTGSGGRLGVVNLALRVTVGGVTYTIGQVVHDSSRIVIEVTPIGSVAKLGPYHVQIGTTRLAFAAARFSPGDTSGPDVYEWKGAYPSWGAAGDKVTLTIYEPLGPENFVPRGADGDNGKVLKRAAAGPAWGTLAYSDLTDRPAQMALTKLNDARITALDVTNSLNNTDSGQALIPFSNSLDLDDYRHGELHVSLTFIMSRPDALGIGFGTDNTGTHNITTIVFLSQLRAVAEWVAGGAIEGYELGDSVDVYMGFNLQLGYVQFYLGRNANGTVGYYWRYRGENGSRSFAIDAHLSVSLSPTDVPAATSGGSSLGGKVADMALTTGSAATYPLNGIVPRSFANAASGYAPDAAGVLRVPKAGQVIGWMFKSLVGGTVIDTVTVPKMSRTVGTDAFGPPIQLTFKNNGRSDVHLSFRSQTNSNYHKLDVRGNGNEIPAQATIEVYEWV